MSCSPRGLLMTLRPRTWLGILAVVGIGAAATLAAPSRDAQYRLKPGATGKLCLECHTDFQEKIAQPFVHTPVKAGDCADCHDPHASDHGKLLETDPNAICAKCHGDILPEDARSTHAAAMGGQCVSCHDPHASAHRANLRLSGNTLCLDCHKEVAGSLASATHKHTPVERSCLGCHSPHASKTAPMLLTKAVPGLCLDCHEADSATFAKEHNGYPVATADCGSCHDPHGSPNEGILWANVHSPVTKGMCNQCHGAAGTPEALSLKRGGPDLCRGCHSDAFNEMQARSAVHWPVLDRRACANCHSPHATKAPKLLTAPQGELCATCHRDAVRRQQTSLAKHPPVEAGECSTCHDPHASDAGFLLAAGSDLELCQACHDWEKHSKHPIGEKAIDPRNPNLTISCLSCHRSHGTPQAHLAHFDPKQELCVQCHASLAR